MSLKTEQLNLKIDPKAKQLLKLAAEKEHRNMTNMIEYLIFSFCEQQHIDLPEQPEAKN